MQNRFSHLDLFISLNSLHDLYLTFLSREVNIYVLKQLKNLNLMRNNLKHYSNYVEKKYGQRERSFLKAEMMQAIYHCQRYMLRDLTSM